MYVFKGTFLCSLICLSLATENNVMELSDDDFSTRIAGHETVLVMFYAPWCGHCKKLKPDYAKAAELIKYNDTPAVLAKVDCTEAVKETCNKLVLRATQPLKYFGMEISSRSSGHCEIHEGTGVFQLPRTDLCCCL